MISRERVVDYIRQLSIATPSLSADEWALADNYFSTLQNQPPYALQHTQIELRSSRNTFSGNGGIDRNKRYMEAGLARLARSLPERSEIETLRPPGGHEPETVDIESYRDTLRPPLLPHPYAHHSRAPCADDTCLFITNVAALPPPDVVRFPYATQANDTITLDAWENSLGWIGRGWIEGSELYADGERWAIDWPFQAAVDRDWQTAWRSVDLIKTEDYIGLMLVDSLISSPQARHLRFHVVLEDDEEILKSNLVTVEVSDEGYEWQATKSRTFECHPTRHFSTAPDLSFLSTPFISSLARTIREGEVQASSGLRGFWTKRKRQNRRLRDCHVELERGTWRFIRLRFIANEQIGLSWGVYELYLSESHR